MFSFPLDYAGRKVWRLFFKKFERGCWRVFGSGSCIYSLVHVGSCLVSLALFSYAFCFLNDRRVFEVCVWSRIMFSLCAWRMAFWGGVVFAFDGWMLMFRFVSGSLCCWVLINSFFILFHANR